MSGLSLTSEMLKWLKSYNFNPPFNPEEMFRLNDSISSLPSLPIYGYFTELSPDYYLDNMDKMRYQDPTPDEIEKIRYCVRNYNEWSKALSSLNEINRLIQTRTGSPFPFQIERIKAALEGVVGKLLHLTTSPNTPTHTHTRINYINVHSIPGIVNGYGNVEKALLFHQKLLTKIGHGLFKIENISRLVDMYHGENYAILHEVFYNAYQIEMYLFTTDTAQNKHHDTSILRWLLVALETIREKVDNESQLQLQLFHDTATFVLDALDPLQVS